MDKEIPTEDEITDLLTRVQPRPKPRFNQRMAGQSWNRGRRGPFWVSLTPMRAAASLGLVLLLVLGVSLLSPSLDTFAQRLSQFFSPSPNSQFVAEIAPLQTAQPTERFTLTIEEAEARAGFEMKIPEPSPVEFRLIGAAYDELREAIILHYVTDSESLVLRVSQQHLDSDYQGIGPEAVIEMVEVGSHAGEYVAGGWMIPEVESGADTTPDPLEPPRVWDANVKLQTLRWSDGEFLYEIILAGGAGSRGYLDKDGLIALANLLR
jgi:hypothetical protein